MPTDNGSPYMERNIRRAQGKWGRLAKILGRKGSDNTTMGRLYVVVEEAVLLFGSETRVLTPRLENPLKRFHRRVARRMAGMGLNYQLDGT